MTKDEIAMPLTQGICLLAFTKCSGELRLMIATRNTAIASRLFNVYPGDLALISRDGVGRNEDILRVIDLEKCVARAARVDYIHYCSEYYPVRTQGEALYVMQLLSERKQAMQDVHQKQMLGSII